MTQTKDQSKLQRRLLWGVLLGAVVYAAMALVADARALLAELGAFPAAVFAGALGLTLVNYGLRFVKWHAYLRKLGYGRVGVGESLNVFVAGLVMSVTPGKAGEVLKSVLLKERHGLPVARTAPIVFAERLTDLLGLFILAAVGIGIFDYGRIAFAISLVAVLALIVVLQLPPVIARLLDLWERLPVVGQARPKLEEAYASTRTLLDWRLMSWTTLLSAVAWGMEAVAFWWILGTLGASQAATVTLSTFVYAMTTILGAVSFLPGGLGVTEGSMMGALMLFEVFTRESAAAAATYLIRFATLWFGVVVGFFALVWLRTRARPAPPDSPDQQASA